MKNEVRTFNEHDFKNHESHPWVDGSDVFPQLLHLHIRDEHDFLTVSDDNLGSILFFLYQDGSYKKLSDNACALFIKNHIPEEIRKPGHWSTL